MGSAIGPAALRKNKSGVALHSASKSFNANWRAHQRPGGNDFAMTCAAASREIGAKKVVLNKAAILFAAAALCASGAHGALAQSAPTPDAEPFVPAIGSPPIGAAPVVSQPAPQAVPEEETAAPAPQLSAPKPKPKRKKQLTPHLETALSDDPTPVLQPETFYATAKASERYAAIMDAGGWPRVGVALKPGSNGPAIVTLRRRLAAEQYLADTTSPTWDPALAEAVRHFQFRMGLKRTGVVSGATLRALDVSASVRFRQLASSAQRLAGVEFGFGPRYVVVNIPAAAVDAVENGRVVRRYTAIVGDVEHRSPEVQAKIVAININPTWTVPASIIKNEIAPKMLKDPSYLSRSRIRVLDGRGAEVDPRSVNWSSERAANYTLRQDSGAGNSLGSLRISMPNPHAVYMHDTPTKKLFSSDYRFLSHGCVRVEGVNDLAAWLLEGAPGSPTGYWDRGTILRRIAGGEREEVPLPRPVPVIWVYSTGWASADGEVHFRDDVYGVDEVGGRADR
jgi:murein L,D-transpeptidase YcbB/YkuD